MLRKISKKGLLLKTLLFAGVLALCIGVMSPASYALNMEGQTSQKIMASEDFPEQEDLKEGETLHIITEDGKEVERYITYEKRVYVTYPVLLGVGATLALIVGIILYIMRKKKNKDLMKREANKASEAQNEPPQEKRVLTRSGSDQNNDKD